MFTEWVRDVNQRILVFFSLNLEHGRQQVHSSNTWSLTGKLTVGLQVSTLHPNVTGTGTGTSTVGRPENSNKGPRPSMRYSSVAFFLIRLGH